MVKWIIKSRLVATIILLLLGNLLFAQDTAKVKQLMARAEGDAASGNTYRAIKTYIDILDLDAGNFRAANALSGLYGHMHQYAEQITWARKAIDINPKYGMAYISLGNAYGARGDMDSAVACYRRAEELNPTSPIPPYCIGVMEESKGQVRDAVVYYQRSIESDTSFVDGYCGLAVAYARLEDYTTAEKYIDQALAIDPKSERAIEIKGRIKEFEKQTPDSSQAPNSFKVKPPQHAVINPK